MEIRLDVSITDFETNIKFDDNQSIIRILDLNNFDFNNSESTLYLLLNNNDVKYIGKTIDKKLRKNKSFDKVIEIKVHRKINLEHLENVFQKNDIDEYKDKILFILKKFGYDLFNIEKENKSMNKSQSGKIRHKWTKDISQIKFIAKSKGGEGEVIWKSKDELVLLSGAKLVKNPQTNKDGSINYSAQFAEKLRLDYADKVENNITKMDIIFPSPNQLGMFLFFGGQNTWVELKDNNGKTLDDWSRVE